MEEVVLELPEVRMEEVVRESCQKLGWRRLCGKVARSWIRLGGTRSRTT